MPRLWADFRGINFPPTLKEFKAASALQNHLGPFLEMGHSIGFVPTMGALHSGHLALVKQALADCHLVVVSIFVNPLQFNNPQDLKTYPSSPEEDWMLLQKEGVHVLYRPNYQDVFGQNNPILFDLDGLDTLLEGASRPNHFQGVANVLFRLFLQVKPSKAYFGLKDYQQVLVVQRLVREHFKNLGIVSIPTLRDPNGLALSSRNRLLTKAQYQQALFVPKFMEELTRNWPLRNWLQTKKELFEGMQSNGLVPDYAVLLKSDGLSALDHFQPDLPMLVSLAWFAGEIRLIDNVPLNQPFTTFETC